MTERIKLAGPVITRLGLVKFIGERPMWTALLSALAISTAFLAGSLLEMGPEYLPLVDKGHLLVLLGFYASGLGLALRVAGTVFSTTTAFAENSVEDVIAANIKSKIERRSHHRAYSSDQIARLATRVARRRRWRNMLWYLIGGTLFLGPMLWFGRDGVIGFLLSEQLLPFASTAAFGTAGGLLVATSVQQAAVGRPRSVYRYKLAIGNYIVLVAAFMAGGEWIEFLEKGAPRLTLQTTGGEQASVSIVMPGTDGFLAFADGSTKPKYIPWHEVRSLISAQPAVPPDQLGSGSVKELPPLVEP